MDANPTYRSQLSGKRPASQRPVRGQSGAQPLPLLTGQDGAAQLRFEDDNVKQCLHNTRERLLV